MGSCPPVVASAPAQALHHAVNSLLHEDRFPLSVVPHLILFFAGEKPAVRIVVKDRTLHKLRPKLNAMGYASADAPIAVKQIGPNWGQLEPVDPSSSSGPVLPTHRIVLISQQKSCAAQILEEEMSGESTESGRQLGYPECCVAAYPALARSASDWPTVMLSRSRPSLSVSMWCNRLSSLWGGACPTGELYPCSLRCSAAIQLGKRADALLRQHGFAHLAQEILRQARRPLYLVNGEVVAGDIDHGRAREIVIHG